MAVIDTVYSYYLTNYGSSGSTKYDSHKKSELRNVWNNIVKTNKEAPLYVLKDKDTKNVSEYVIDVKESARSLTNVISSLTPEGSDIESAFQKKIASKKARSKNSKL